MFLQRSAPHMNLPKRSETGILLLTERYETLWLHLGPSAHKSACARGQQLNNWRSEWILFNAGLSKSKCHVTCWWCFCKRKSTLPALSVRCRALFLYFVIHWIWNHWRLCSTWGGGQLNFDEKWGGNTDNLNFLWFRGGIYRENSRKLVISRKNNATFDLFVYVRLQP